MKVSVIIPAYNEEAAIGSVVRAVPRHLVQEVIVVDNGSTDATAAEAQSAGARIVREPFKGYGAACRAGLKACGTADVVVFLDGDTSDDPAELPLVLKPIEEGLADFVIGSRLAGAFLDPNSMPCHARMGNRFVALLLNRAYGLRITDIGSFRALRAQLLLSLQMEQMTYGWPVEMLVKAAQRGARIAEVPVSYRRRIGVSKVSGTIRGSVLAAYYMLWLPLFYLANGSGRSNSR
ncbi:MAG: glycosyltransferase family 2 protein [Desulfobacteraceae bacterium]|nr:MAG: glycosyltransferase family 2 protein [Desulfobacteraceae bacterium]